MRVRTTANLGAYLSTFASCIPTILYATLLAGQYKTPAIYCEVTAVFTNTVPVDAYRGAGRPEATYVVERLVETAAREIKLDPIELRRRNFITEFPYQTPVALCYDTGNYEATLGAVLKLADVAGFKDRREQSLRRGKLRGLGYACYIEACGIAPSNVAGSLGARAGLFEGGEVRVRPAGTVTVFTGSHAPGQGHETTFAQVVADRLGLGMEQVEIVHGDTSKVLFGMGTYGSRSIAVGGTAIVKALDKIVAKGCRIAAHLMKVADNEVTFHGGTFVVEGTGKSVPFAQVALAAYVPHDYPLATLEPGLDEIAFYDPTNFTYPAGTHICEVEVDPETGQTAIVNFTACDDFGNIVNPMIVEGQVHGGVARHRVVHVSRREQLARLAVVDAAFQQRLADALRDPAVHLALDDHRIHDVAEVVAGGEVDDRRLSGLGVDLDLADVGSRGVREVGGIGKGDLVQPGLERGERVVVRHVGGERDPRERHALARALDDEGPAVERDFAVGDLHQARADAAAFRSS